MRTGGSDSRKVKRIIPESQRHEISNFENRYGNEWAHGREEREEKKREEEDDGGGTPELKFCCCVTSGMIFCSVASLAFLAAFRKSGTRETRSPNDSANFDVCMVAFGAS
jgi:hypothetical protein